MKKILLLLMFFAVASVATAQSLTLAELQNLCKLSNWQTANDMLTRKGWEFHSSSKGDYDHYASIEFAFSKSDWNAEYATAWLVLYIDGSQVEKVNYVAPKNTYNVIKNSLAANGYKRIDNQIEDGNITTFYSNSTYNLKLIQATTESEYGGTKTSYRISISRK